MTDTKIILISCIVTDIDERRISVMVALICILGECPRMIEWHHSDF